MPSVSVATFFLRVCCSALISFNSALRPSMMSLCCVIVTFRLAMSHATSSRFVPLPLPPPENSKQGVLLVPAKEVLSPLHLLSTLVILLDSEGGDPSCVVIGVILSEPLGGPWDPHWLGQQSVPVGRLVMVTMSSGSSK